MQQHQKFRNDVFDLIGDENLVAVKLDLVLLKFEALLDLRKIKDTGQIERIIDIEMYPEQRRFAIRIQFLVKILIVLARQLTRLLRPGRLDIVDLLTLEPYRYGKESTKFLQNRLN